jgi:stress-induced morphogen
MMSEWEKKKTDETRKVEAIFRTVFPRTDAYRFNSASIRVRVIDPRFEGKSTAEREDMVFPLLKKLPKRTREDILLLLTLAPSEEQTQMTQTMHSQSLINLEFEHPLHSNL